LGALAGSGSEAGDAAADDAAQHQQQAMMIPAAARFGHTSPDGIFVQVAAAAPGAAGDDRPGSSSAPIAIQQQQQQQRRSSVDAAEGSYRGPIKDPSSASLWDLQFMANRMAMEGSAHGNAYAHK
jgi:hypothetical protein